MDALFLVRKGMTQWPSLMLFGVITLSKVPCYRWYLSYWSLKGLRHMRYSEYPPRVFHKNPSLAISWHMLKQYRILGCIDLFWLSQGDLNWNLIKCITWIRLIKSGNRTLKLNWFQISKRGTFCHVHFDMHSHQICFWDGLYMVVGVKKKLY